MHCISSDHYIWEIWLRASNEADALKQIFLSVVLVEKDIPGTSLSLKDICCKTCVFLKKNGWQLEGGHFSCIHDL